MTDLPSDVFGSVTIPVTFGEPGQDRSADPAFSERPPALLVDRHPVTATYVDWTALTGAVEKSADSAASPSWQDIPAPGTGSQWTLTFDSGPLPAAVSVVGYNRIEADGFPTGSPQRDHGALPAAGVAQTDGHLTLDTRSRPEFLAVQFRWLVPPDQRTDGQSENTSVTATYLIHLTVTRSEA